MGVPPKQQGHKPGEPGKAPVILLLSTIGDTSWRMFLPTIGATLAGVYGDNTLSTKPWLTLTGIIIGTIIAAALIRNQMKKVQKN